MRERARELNPGHRNRKREWEGEVTRLRKKSSRVNLREEKRGEQGGQNSKQRAAAEDLHAVNYSCNQL